ncbi:unnamed protein product [Candidula unifasciata]|uniref:Extradiol ring-cleavage dioxygenase class III enzyme subunit B domain-containing protein n=1 Tax=Candidula unifasciata TaxID=100452 RepID=A0A8S3YHA5_9EUPU|nr:unnamed protein product [Candidula unifasciata]
MYLLFLSTISSLLHPAASKILANFVMPHGGIALDPTHFNATNSTALEQAWEIHRACKQVGEEIASLKPELILLSTPHGIADLRNFVLYLNPVASGFADTDNCDCPPCCYNATVNVDTGMSQFIVEALGYQNNVSGLSGYGPPGQSSEPFPLRWGEVIPFHFMPGLNESKVVILSHPSRRYSEDVEMIPELLKLGSSLYSILETSSKRVVIVISADLAHTHSASGPYGYSNASEPFDEACGKWATSLQPDYLLTTAASLVDQALSCGYTGLVTLHGLMEAGDIATWTPSLRVNHHPSYYGMMVASFYRSDLFPVSVHVEK